MKKISGLLTLALALVSTGALAAGFTPGNIVVLQEGDGTAALSSAANVVFLQEYTTSGALVQTVAVPGSGSGSNRALTQAGSSTSEGYLTRSADGRYLILAGYDAAAGTTGVAATASTTVNRVVGRVDSSAAFNISTALTDAYSAGNIRSAASTNGTDLWVAGSNGGVRYATLGGTTSTQLSTTPTNVRVVNVYGGQLYVSSASGAFQGVSTVGTGTPTTSGQTTTLLNGMPTATGPSNYDYWFANSNTLYVSDDTGTNKGLEKWTLNSGTWSLAETITNGLTSSSIGLRGLTGVLNGNNATLYAASSDNKLVSLTEAVTDTTGSASFTTLATAGTNTAFRGVRFAPQAVPEPGTIAALALGALAVLRKRSRK